MADTVVEPVLAALTRPAEPVALLIVATVVLLEAQVTWVVRFWVVASVYVPVAVSCWVMPRTTDGLAGVMAMETSSSDVTVMPVEPVTAPWVALSVVEPTLAPVARPREPAALLMVAMLVSPEDQVTEAVRSCVVASVYTPVAVICWVVPRASDGVAGVREMEASRAAVTLSGVEVVTAPLVAVTVTSRR